LFWDNQQGKRKGKRRQNGHYLLIIFARRERKKLTEIRRRAHRRARKNRNSKLTTREGQTRVPFNDSSEERSGIGEDHTPKLNSF